MHQSLWTVLRTVLERLMNVFILFWTVARNIAASLGTHFCLRIGRMLEADSVTSKELHTNTWRTASLVWMLLYIRSAVECLMQ
jgi:hypothetical protein